MIAAAPPRDSSLSLVKLIFSLSVNPTQEIPDELKSHLINTIQEAKDLLHTQSHISKQSNPEAIALAIELKKNKELVDAVEEITSFESINPDLAGKVLEKLKGDNNFAYKI